MGKFIDRTGERVGRLTIVKIAGRDKHGNIVWECKCDCGNIKNIVGRHINTAHTISCGCYNKEHNLGKARNTKHNQSKTRLYKIWAHIRVRCNKDGKVRYKYYNERGIEVCAEWEKFEKFYEWAIENGYDDNLTIDRIDYNKGYSPDNCRWATIEQQNNNKRNNIVYVIDGERLTLKQISEKFNINYKKLFARVKYLGWSIDRAISE